MRLLGFWSGLRLSRHHLQIRCLWSSLSTIYLFVPLYLVDIRKELWCWSPLLQIVFPYDRIYPGSCIQMPTELNADSVACRAICVHVWSQTNPGCNSMAHVNTALNLLCWLLSSRGTAFWRCLQEQGRPFLCCLWLCRTNRSVPSPRRSRFLNASR